MPYEMLTSLTLRTSYTLADEDDGSGTQRPCIRYGCGPVCWKWARLKGCFHWSRFPRIERSLLPWYPSGRIPTMCSRSPTCEERCYSSVVLRCVHADAVCMVWERGCMLFGCLHRQLSLHRWILPPCLGSPSSVSVRAFPTLVLRRVYVWSGA